MSSRLRLVVVGYSFARGAALGLRSHSETIPPPGSSGPVETGPLQGLTAEVASPRRCGWGTVDLDEEVFEPWRWRELVSVSARRLSFQTRGDRRVEGRSSDATVVRTCPPPVRCVAIGAVSAKDVQPAFARIVVRSWATLVVDVYVVTRRRRWGWDHYDSRR